MKQLLLFLFSILLPLLNFAGKTVIQGTISGFNDEKIRLAYFEDYISFKKVHLGEGKISNDQFRLEFEIDRTRQVIILIQDKQTSLFAETGQVYNVTLSYNEESNTERAFEKFLDLKFSYPNANDLNQRIRQFNDDYQEFFSKNYRKFVVKEASSELKAFIEEEEAKDIYKQPSYLSNYVKYALANLKDINNDPKEEIYNTYLSNSDILPAHKEFMNFFSQFYDGDFEQVLITKSGKDLMKAIMFDKDLEKSLQILMNLKGFKSQELTELYLINGLFEVYYKRTVDQKSNLALLAELSKKASTPDLRKTAANISKKLKIGSENSRAPFFKLPDSKGGVVSLDDLKGKPIYLGFWANWSTLSLKELKVMQKLHSEYGNQIHFVSINIDEDNSFYTSVPKENHYAWHFLYAGNQYELREEYEVKTAPIYYILNEKGEIIKRFAPGPEHIERELKRLIVPSN